jgi:ABC-type nickel/cobalt efflux system permease component RcnA
MRRVLVAAAVAAVLAPGPAQAHPLGLPAFAQVVASAPDEVTVRWNAAPDDVAALARSLGQQVPRGRVLTRAEDDRLAGSPELAARVAADVVVRQDGRACTATFVPPGSVVTEGITTRHRCPARVGRVRLRIALLHDVDGRYRTLAAIAGPGGVAREMFTSTTPEHDVVVDPAASGALTPDTAAPADDVRGAFGGSLPLERRFVTALDSSPGVAGYLLALLVAFGVGAVHALAPGHGKAIGAAYMVGELGRVRDAAVLGTTVAVMHTGSVLALGLALWSATRRPDAARLTATIGLVTGVVFAALGAWLLVRRWRERAAPHAAENGHTHAVPRAPLSREGLVALGAAGGLLPSPSALLVLLTALAVGRVAYGLGLIVAFSAGLAATLTAVGIAVLRGGDVAHDRAGARLHGLVHRAPLLGAVVVLVLGLAIATRAALQL